MPERSEATVDTQGVSLSIKPEGAKVKNLFIRGFVILSGAKNLFIGWLRFFTGVQNDIGIGLRFFAYAQTCCIGLAPKNDSIGGVFFLISPFFFFFPALPPPPPAAPELLHCQYPSAYGTSPKTGEELALS